MNSPKCVAEMLYDTVTKYEIELNDLQLEYNQRLKAIDEIHKAALEKLQNVSEQNIDLESVIEKQADRIRYLESQLRLHYED
jgi:predicted RNase H-like nuclease (RuvC/YqgF family)